jgi:hypothetical protein
MQLVVNCGALASLMSQPALYNVEQRLSQAQCSEESWDDLHLRH